MIVEDVPYKNGCSGKEPLEYQESTMHEKSNLQTLTAATGGSALEPSNKPTTTSTAWSRSRTTIVWRRSRAYTIRKDRLRNSMLWGIGYLELANAGDFPANVFNDTPVPLYAAILMGIGGSLACCMVLVAIRDFKLSLANVQLLKRERVELTEQLQTIQTRDKDPSPTEAIRLETYLNVNLREIGAEFVDRIELDVLLGIGSLLVGVGTLMAIGGNNPAVFQASNLLSGYIGNSPSALYGVTNLTWSVWIWLRSHHHKRLALKHLSSDVVDRFIYPRATRVQAHAVISGISGLVGGVGSLLSTTKWWGYIVLAPVVISQIWINFYWRHRVAYGRALLQEEELGSSGSIIDELYALSSIEQVLKAGNIAGLFDSSTAELHRAMELIVQLDMFEEFCIKLYRNHALRGRIFPTHSDEGIVISVEDILHAKWNNDAEVTSLAKSCIQDKGRVYIQYRQRFLTEFLGAYQTRWELKCMLPTSEASSK